MVHKLISVFLSVICLLTLVNSQLFSQQANETNQLIINSLPEGASVFINDVYCGKTPYKSEDLKSGKTDVKVTLNGITRQQLVASLMGKQEMFFIMDGDYGLFNFNTSPLSAKVFIDDSLSGETPLSDIKLTRGIHKITLMRDTYDKIERTVNVYPMKYSYNFKLERKYGFISLKNDQSGPLSIDGYKALTDENNEFKLENGERYLEFQPKGFYKAISGRFEIKGGAHYELNAVYNYSTPKYVICSALLPGLGQILDRSALKGGIYTLGTLLCGAAYIVADQKHETGVIDYQELQKTYNEASNESDAAIAREHLESKVDEINKLSRFKGVFLSAAIGIYILNVADAIIFHTTGSELQLNKTFDLNADNNQLGIRIKLR